jgi:hypothetical protein
MLRKLLAALACVVVMFGVLAACDPPPPESPTATCDGSSPADATLNLPTESWYGGSAYFCKFPDAVKAGWAKKSHFPVGVWWAYWPDGSGDDAVQGVQWYKDHGINFFSAGNGSQSFCALQKVGGMSWVDGPLQDAAACSDGVWPGTFQDDEVDGRYSESAGKATLARGRDQLRAQYPGKFISNNFTSGVIQYFPADSYGEGYVNGDAGGAYQDIVSMDDYTASSPNRCNAGNPNYFPFITSPQYPAPSLAHCRDPQSYGKEVEAMKIRDAADGKLMPVTATVDDACGADPCAVLPTPAQVEAGGISTVIHGAGYLYWFNNSFAQCVSGNVLRDAQMWVEGKGGSACTVPYADAVKRAGEFVKLAAPWLNSQPYKWNFGPGLETRLSVHGNLAGILAMTDGSTGARTFTLPPDLAAATSVGVVGGDPIPVVDGKFTYTFTANTDYRAFVVQVPA